MRPFSRFAGLLASLAAVLLTASFAPAAPPVPALTQSASLQSGLTQCVDPMIGTDGGGNTFPGPSAPFGMVQFSPDTHAPSIGYSYGDKQIEGFSLTHMSGVGCDNCGNVFLTATTGPITPKAADYASPFRHQTETARAGYYQVRLDRWNIGAELTATERTGLVRFTFPAGQPANLLVPISHTLTRTTAAKIRISGSDTLEGSVTSRSFCGSGETYTVYFVMRVDRPFASSGTFTGETVTEGALSATVNTTNGGAAADSTAAGIGAYAGWPSSPTPFTVTARIGISYVDLDGARRNLDREAGRRPFDAVRRLADQAWERALKRIEVTGGTDAQRTRFYTSLYHCFLMPSLFSDSDGRYLGYDKIIHRSPPGHAVYANFSGWDIYRTEAPLLALIQPQRLSDMCQSVALMYRQGGWIDRWPQANTYTNVMCGSPLTVMLATAWNTGLRGFDMQAAYAGMLKDATQAPPGGKPYSGESNVAYIDKLGYIPDDKEEYGSVSQTEEDCIAYAALGSIAASLGKTHDAQYLRQRAFSYRNLYDPETKFLRPRRADGSWDAPFDPAQEHGYVEGTGWHYLWLAPHDAGGLVRLLGGDAAFNARLDQFFSYTHPTWSSRYYNPYNETDLQAPFLYQYSGSPWKTQARVRELLADAYKITPDGIPGNDDCGTMSAWYVLAALGLYPTDPARPAYELFSPLFPRAAVHLGGSNLGKSTLTILAPNTSASNIYVRGMTLGGKAWPRSWVTYAALTQSQTLAVTLGTRPDKAWGAAPAARPPSLSGETKTLWTPIITPQAGFVGTQVTLRSLDPDAVLRYTTDGSVPTQTSRKYTGPFPMVSCGTVQARAYKPGFPPSRRVSASFDQPGLPGTGTGLTGTYYPDKDLSGPGVTRLDSVLQFNFSGDTGPVPGVGSQNWSARWTGSLLCPRTDTYTLSTDSDDGIRVWLDGRMLIDHWNDHSPAADSAAVSLQAGQKYALKVEYFNGVGSGLCRLSWQGRCRRHQPVPSAYLYP